MKKDNLRELKERILGTVREFYKEESRRKKSKFIPGITPIYYARRTYDERELINLINASLEFWLTDGRYTVQFETKLAKYIGTKYASFVNSGSSANLLAVSALTSPLLKEKRLKPGDEIITTALCFPTTVTPIIQNRLTPVFVDVDLGTYNAKIDQVKKAVSKKTKAIFLAHTLGNPFNLKGIMQICKENDLWLIGDNADAIGAAYAGKKTGAFEDISTYSFYPAHHITTGEGGAVLTDNPLINKIITSFRDWGRDCWCKTGVDNTCRMRFCGKYARLPAGYDHKYIYSHLGYNLKATDLQAAIGVAQLDKLPAFILKRRENHISLYKGLKGVEDKIILPVAEKDSKPSWFGFTIILKDNCRIKRRDALAILEKAKIQTRLLFAGNVTKQPCFSGIKKGRDYKIIGALPNTDKVMRDGFWVGVYPCLDKDMIEYMLQILNGIFLS